MKKNFYKLYGFRIILVVVFLLGFIMMGSRRTLESNSNAVEDWLPSNFQETKDYKWFLRHFPFESFIIVSWEGCQFDEENEIHEDQIELFAQKLVPSQTIDNFSLMAPTSELEADLNSQSIADRLLQNSSENLNTAAPKTAEKEKTTNSTQPEVSYFRSVMTGPRLVRLLEQSYAKTPQMKKSPEEIRDMILDRLVGTLVGPDHKSTAVMITLNSGFKGGGKKMQELINRVKAVSVECGLPDTMVVKSESFAARAWKAVTDTVCEIISGRHPRTDALILGGPPVDNAALDQEGSRTLFRLAGICAIISVTLALICLHDIRLTMFVFWIAIISAGIALAMVSFTGSKCDSILLSMPALVYVLAMSGAIHLINYYHDAIREGGLEGAVERSVKHAFPPSFFAQLTTAIGLGSLFASQLVPIIKFGFYSAVGVLTTLLLLFLYLPALLDVFPSKKFAQRHGGKGLSHEKGFLANFWEQYGKIIVYHHNFFAFLCFVAMIFYAFSLPKLQPSVKMMNFFSDDAEIIAHYSWLEEKLGPLVPMELVVSFDNSQLPQESFGTTDRLSLIRRICNELQEDIRDPEDQSALIGGALSVATFTPDIDSFWSEGSNAYRIASTAIGKNIDENRANLKDYLTVEGNPSLDEMIQFLTNEALPIQDDYQHQREKFRAILQESEVNESLLGPDVTADNFDLENYSSNTTNDDVSLDSTIRAHQEDLLKTEKSLVDLLKMKQVLTSRKEFLNNNGMSDLDGIMNHLAENTPYKVITGTESNQLRKICELWQSKKGIELWRISIRVWALKKDIDYSAFIKQVKAKVQPLLSEVSKDLMFDLYGVETDQYDYLAEAGLHSKEESKNFLARIWGEKVDLSYLQTDDPELQRIRAEFGIDAQDEEIASQGGPHADDIIFPAGISAKYTGMVPLVYKTQHALINGLLVSIIMAFLVIGFVFVVYLKSFMRAVVAMIPNIFPVIIVFGFMAWIEMPVDVGTMMTASVALGVAVDDTMHYLTWFSHGVDCGLSRKEAAIQAYRRCAPAMTESTLIAGLGLFAFAFSTFVPTQRFGVLMLAILFVAEIGDLVFLASLLTGPLGIFFDRPKRKKKMTSSVETPAEPAVSQAQ